MKRSVVICGYTTERWDVMQRAISGVEGQDVEAEIVVVVDHNDELLAIATERWPSHTVVANRFERGLSGARNTGVSVAAGDVIAFLDDDAVPRDGWLRALTDRFHDPSVGLTGGRVEPMWLVDRPGWIPDEFLWVVGCSYRGLPVQPTEVRNPIGASMAVRRTVFDEVGLFRDGIGRIGNVPLGGEETELSIRARRRGFVAFYEPASVVDHEVTANRVELRYFLRRCWAEGLSKAVIADTSGADQALESERAHMVLLVRSIVEHLRRAVTGPERADQARRAALIVSCTGVAGFGYLRGKLRRSAPALPEPPRLHGSDVTPAGSLRHEVA